MSPASYHLRSTRDRELVDQRDNILEMQLPVRARYLAILNKQSGQILAAWPAPK